MKISLVSEHVLNRERKFEASMTTAFGTKIDRDVYKSKLTFPVRNFQAIHHQYLGYSLSSCQYEM